MTKRECAIVTLHTGINMLEGEDIHYLYDYAASLIGRPIVIYDLVTLEKEFKELSRKDFIELCKTATD